MHDDEPPPVARRSSSRGSHASLPPAHNAACPWPIIAAVPCGTSCPISSRSASPCVNPIQYGCTGMDAAALKRDFGASLTFMGGLDTIGLIPRGTAAKCMPQHAHLIDTMTADGGGFILAASHTIPPETPVANIFAMYAAAGITRRRDLRYTPPRSVRSRRLTVSPLDACRPAARLKTPGKAVS